MIGLMRIPPSKSKLIFVEREIKGLRVENKNLKEEISALKKEKVVGPF